VAVKRLFLVLISAAQIHRSFEEFRAHQMHRVKIFGERNTGTNALQKILEKNSLSKCFPSNPEDLVANYRRRYRKWRLLRMLTLSDRNWFDRKRELEVDKIFDGQTIARYWKHSATFTSDVTSLRGASVFFCVRHPVSWVYALWRNPYNSISPRTENFFDFVNSEWSLLGRDNLGSGSVSPAELYIKKIKSYGILMAQLERTGIPHQLVKMEDLISDQAGVFRRVSSMLNEPSTTFKELRSSTKSSLLSIEDYKNYYGNELWREEIGSALPQLSAMFPDDLFDWLGYKR